MIRVAIVTGGESTEREVALRSAENVKEILASRYQILVFDFPTDLEKFIANKNEIDIAIPIMHGRGGEDGVLQGFFETLKIPYIFSGVSAHAAAMDKNKTKVIVSSLEIKTPESKLINREVALDFTHPVVVKPNDGGSSVATAIVRSPKEFDDALAGVFTISDLALVEDYISGQEFTVAVIDVDGLVEALPVIMIKPKTEFFDYTSKYDAKLQAEEICPAPISDDLAQSLQNIAVKVHCALGCKHLSRSDFIVNKNGEIWFLEINTIPGLTRGSLTPKAVTAAGKSLADLFDRWIKEVL